MNKHTLVALTVASVLAGCATSPTKDAPTSPDQPNDSVIVQPEPSDNVSYEEENDLPEFEIDPVDEIEPIDEPEETVKKVLPIEDETGALILGNKEYLYLPKVERSFTAGVDEDLDLSVMSVANVTPFERNGKKWVSFTVQHDDISTKEFSLPVKSWRKLATDNKAADSTSTASEKEQTTEEAKQAVVTAWVQVGKLKESTDFLLSEESKLPYPFMLGKSFYRDLAVIDNSREFVQPKVSK
jgi:hypothetical protein